MAVLNEELVLSKTKCKDLEHVRNLNVFGSDVEDVSILQKMPSVEVLSLSANKIKELRWFACCPRLQELYLRRNEIANIEEIQHLRGLKYLQCLMLSDNPCVGSAPDKYRKTVIAMIPRLYKLDGVEITNEEREEAESAFAASPMIPALNLQQMGKLVKPPIYPSQQVSPKRMEAAGNERKEGSGNTERSPRPASPFQDSPRRIPAMTGETSKNVLSAVQLLIRELNLDGLMMLKTDIDSRIRLAFQANAGL
ncbi:hypothetical protein GUITHDRAFT_100916 [Guillardia theta CCMP2712]|uniref:U2A'/phosphoprotein 32 family A C-terminal domain-containing protein n=1 Tax=Guillardia theta (strain CCMP2712) TaxID=905079 RepID=L1JX98_GUITC|nr:hypothetical protein GUITHDRAFT_100916 [Guillardia theta CCMP2712]EKX53206.1 hypothetical protein GUITHDRAFT_100916 [Guillardia theta CCMP2712]|eukprot:XP_005840186.1 hypothetical protein GUITHDRAFT_100916 [Guillardia theta CCMP2712]